MITKIIEIFTKNIKFKILAMLITMYIFFVKKSHDVKIEKRNNVEKSVEE